MKNNARAELVIDALLMAVWRRKPKSKVIVHSDQYTSSDWRTCLNENNLEASMSRRGNCYDNAVAESFFSSLKTERIKRRVFKTREEAKEEIFNYIEYITTLSVGMAILAVLHRECLNSNTMRSY